MFRCLVPATTGMFHCLFVFCLAEVNALPLMASVSFCVYLLYVIFPLFLFRLSIALITTAAHHHPPLIIRDFVSSRFVLLLFLTFRVSNY